MKNLAVLILSGFLSALLFCNNPKDNIAGGGDETQTGNRIVGCLVDYRDGQPANNASVRLYHGDTALPASIALDSTISDAGGKYRFDSIAAGTYTIECRKVDGTDTLSAMHRHIRHDTLTVTDVGVDTLKAPGKISGSVDFNSSNKMGVTVFVPGTSFIAITDSSGAFCISYVPPDTYEVAYSYYGYLTAYDTAVVVHANTTTFLPVKHLARDPGVPPPPPAGLKASYDTLRGIVTISWNDLHDSTVAGYIVFRKDTAKSAQDPTQISGLSLVADTFYCDTPYNSLSDTNPYTFRYYVKSQDTSGNRSLTYSQPVMVTVYPYLPSMPQPADGAIDLPINLTLSWHKVKEDSVVYNVFLDTVASPHTLVYAGKNTSVPITTALMSEKTYYWYVTASVGTDTVRGPVWHFTTKTGWEALGSGMNDYVRSLALDSSGNLYAGGGFTTAGGVTVNHIAKWNDSTWSALGSGMNGVVSVLVVDGSGNLYAGGDFDTAGGIAASNIAKWNGSAWSALGSGINGIIIGGPPAVYALAIDVSGNLYAGGRFDTAGGILASNIAKWNGSTWSALGSGTSGDYNIVLALAFDSIGNLYAGGSFTTAGGILASNIAKWNGSAWSALGSGTGYGVEDLAFDSSGSLYVGGDFSTAGGIPASAIARWNGSTWSALGSGMNDYVRSLALDSSGNLYAGGGFTTAGGVTVNHIAKWNGSAWSALGIGTNDQVYDLIVNGSGNLFAGGYFTTAGGVAANYIAKWK